MLVIEVLCFISLNMHMIFYGGFSTIFEQKHVCYFFSRT